VAKKRAADVWGCSDAVLAFVNGADLKARAGCPSGRSRAGDASGSAALAQHGQDEGVEAEGSAALHSMREALVAKCVRSSSPSSG
jgi:hypothetical protein